MLALAVTAAVAGGCPDGADRWLQQCAAGGELSASIVACPAGHLIVDVSTGGAAPIRVDIARATDRSFRATGGLGLSPVGEFVDWRAVDPRRRAALDQLAMCAARDPGFALGRSDARASPPGVVVPWRLGAGLLLIAAMIAMRCRDRGGLRVAREAAPLLALAVATGLFRWLMLDAAFFHQNGQGPLWVAYAGGEPSSYGPGFHELFGAVVSWAPADPEAALFSAQAVAAALGPACAWVLARRTGAPALVAWAIAGALAIDPMWARLAGSESYYASCGSLLLLAGAALALASHSRIALATASVAAGLLIAQAARVHPVAWVPASLLPVLFLVGEGELRARAVRAVASAATIAMIVAVTAAPVMLAVIRGDLGNQWLEHVNSFSISDQLGTLVVIAVALASIARWRRDATVAVIAAAATVAIAALTSVLGSEVAWIHQSYWRLALVPAIAPVAAAVAHLGRSHRSRTAVAATIAALAMTGALVQWSSLTELPTDAREAALVRHWRDRVPDDARVYYVGRAAKRVVSLPWLGRGRQLMLDGEGSETGPLPPGAFYYLSSLCSTDVAATLCASIEAQPLEVIVSAELPAIPSKPELGYNTAPIRVGLYRVVVR